MVRISALAWKATAYFVSFEGVFWFLGRRFMEALLYYLEDGTPLVNTNPDLYGIFNSYSELLISLLGLAFSIWCFKKFIETVFEVCNNG